jgi:hypothetical protein
MLWTPDCWRSSSKWNICTVYQLLSMLSLQKYYTNGRKGPNFWLAWIWKKQVPQLWNSCPQKIDDLTAQGLQEHVKLIYSPNYGQQIHKKCSPSSQSRAWDLEVARRCCPAKAMMLLLLNDLSKNRWGASNRYYGTERVLSSCSGRKVCQIPIVWHHQSYLSGDSEAAIIVTHILRHQSNLTTGSK